MRQTTEEMLSAKALWSEIFYEDSDVFTDYYFREKMQDNIGYGIKEDGKLVAMLYLTPYTGMLRMACGDSRQATEHFTKIPLFYIVGVGTKKEYRHRGFMDALLRQALEDIREKGHPFTFLMPANPAIYTPYQFRYIYDRPEFLFAGQERLSISERISGVGRIPAQERMRAEEAEELAVFAEKQLKMRYQLFLHRDADYYIRQQKESQAQNGDVYIWKEEGKIKGFYLYAKEETEFIQEALAEQGFERQMGIVVSQKKKPIIMARITDVCSMLTLIRLKQEALQEAVAFELEIKDELLSANNGTFLWTVGKKESTIAMVEKTKETAVQISIADLTEFLFGRKAAGECFVCPGEEGLPDALYERLSWIDVISHSFINEIV